MEAGFEAHLRIGAVTFDSDDVSLLRAISDHRSLNAAARSLDRSFSRTHTRVKELESEVGPLVDRQRGGAGGGGSELTDAAHRLIAQFARLQAALDGTAKAEEMVLDGTVVDREGELVTVDTPAGTVQAMLFQDAERVQVTLRADAVTLHAPDSAPQPNDTSALNRFRGEVTHIEPYEAIVTVSLDVGAQSRLQAIITQQSLERLDIETGSELVVTFKAMATRAVPV